MRGIVAQAVENAANPRKQEALPQPGTPRHDRQMSEDDEISDRHPLVEMPPDEAFEPAVTLVDDASPPKVLTTNEAMQTLAAGAFGLGGGGLLVVFGGVFVTLGLVWAAAFSVLIVVLHRTEIASAWRSRRFTSHLALPAAVVVAVPVLVILVANKDTILAIGRPTPAAVMADNGASAKGGRRVCAGSGSGSSRLVPAACILNSR